MRKLVDTIDKLLPTQRPIKHHTPIIGHNSGVYLNDALSDITSNAPQLELARRLESYCGVQHAVPVSTGTAALELALKSVGVRPGEEVIVPTLTFSATASAVVHIGAVPHYVDNSTSINAFKLRRFFETKTQPTQNKRGRKNIATDRTISAIIGVDLLGYPADWEKLQMVATDFGMILIEDAAASLGSNQNGRKCGSFGAAAIISFNNNKIITGNCGGAVLTNDEWVAAQVHDLANTCRKEHPWHVEHTGIGYNYRMPTINTALILRQFGLLDDILKAKRDLFWKYQEAGCPMLLPEPWQGRPNYWLSTMLMDNSDQRDECLRMLHERGILARALFTPLHTLPEYKDFPRMVNLLQAEDLFNKAICLPSGLGAIAWT